MLWLAPIPVGLLTGHLHLTWGNLSFHPSEKAMLLGWFSGLFFSIWLGLTFGVRTPDRSAGRQIISAGLSILAVSLGIAAWRTGLPMMSWLPGSFVELTLLGIAAGSLHRISASPVGPAIAASMIWMTRTGGMTMADGPFDGVGMIVTTPTYSLLSTAGWPMILTLALLLRVRRTHPR